MSRPLPPSDFESDGEHNDSLVDATQQQGAPLGAFSVSAINLSAVPAAPQNTAGLVIQIPANNHATQISPVSVAGALTEDEPELPPAPPNSVASNPSGGFFSQNQQGGGRF